jgi:ubiquinone/menaquinone biosynthesis C-methylase UbiE
MWIILTEPGKQGRWNENAFFQSGRDEIAQVLRLLDGQGLSPRFGTALDFGCGIGRLTHALGERFERVHGVDISPTMIAMAREKNRVGSRVTYHVNATESLPMLATGSVDFIYSNIVLQHIPRHAAEQYVREFGRVMAPGGIAVFQTLTRARRWTVRFRHWLRDSAPDTYRWLRDLISRRPRWEMNVLPEAPIREALSQSDVQVRHVLDDDAGGEQFESCRFIAVRGRSQAG